MADEPDATLVIEPDEPAFVKAINEMAQTMEARFKKSGETLKTTFSGIAGGSPGQSFTQSPVAQVTKEMEKQVKWAKEITKSERERREIARARRFESNRDKHGDDIELDENGNVKRYHGAERGRRRAIGAISGGIHAGSTFAFGGGSPQSIIQGSTQIASMIAPEIAPILNSIAGVAMSALGANDTRVEAALRGYQVGGNRGANMFALSGGQGKGDGSLDDYRKMLGFDYERFSNLQTHLGRKTGGLNSMRTLMEMENSFGLGGTGVNFLGANARSGHDTSEPVQEKAMANAFGLAVAENLGKGRFGEVFDQIASAMEENTKGLSDVHDLADKFMFISQLGPQYRGNTNASRDMNQSINSLASGAKPYTQLAALRAGGFGQPGVSYAQAWLKTQIGLTGPGGGGIQWEDVIKTNYGSYIPSYARASADGKASIIYQLSQLTGMNGAQVKAIMDRLAQGPLGHIDEAAADRDFGRARGMGGGAEALTRVRRQATDAESAKAAAGGFFNWVGGAGDERGGIGDNNPTTEPVVSGGGASGGGSGTSSGGFDPNDVTNNASFVNGWIQEESGGNIQSRDEGSGLEDWRGARGYGQITREEAKRLGITSEAEYRRLSTDPQFSMEMSKKLMMMKAREAQGTAKKFGLNWGKSDMLRLTKYEHGGEGFVNSGMSQFEKQYSRAPKSWDEYYGALHGNVEGDSRESRRQGERALDNANHMGGINSQVTVVVVDKTQHGVDVHHENASYAAQARRPSPGDAPVTSPDQTP